jgi:hypothetical protein
MNLELTPDERELLLETVKERLGEIRGQIHHSTTSSFTDRLKRAEQTLDGLIERLEAGAEQ